MRFLVDENCDSVIVSALREHNHDVIYIAESAPGDADVDILEQSITEQRVLITQDHDFCELVFRDSKPAYAIILVRIIPRTLKAAHIVKLLQTHEADLVGNFATLTVDDVRLRPLP